MCIISLKSALGITRRVGALICAPLYLIKDAAVTSGTQLEIVSVRNNCWGALLEKGMKPSGVRSWEMFRSEDIITKLRQVIV